jgi:hypothetical protein
MCDHTVSGLLYTIPNYAVCGSLPILGRVLSLQHSTHEICSKV